MAASSHRPAIRRRPRARRARLWRKLVRFGWWVRARLAFWGCELGARVTATGYVRARRHRGARLVIGSRSSFLGGMVPTEIVCHPGACLEIGDETVFNYGAAVEAWGSIHIGRRCMFASFVVISDKGRDATSAIVIEDDVWIAHGAVVAPGVTIGARSVIAARSYVCKDVPPDSLVIGNPARVMSIDLLAS